MTGNEMERKIDAVLGALTLEEKIKMIHGAGLFRTGAVERLNIPSLKMSDGPMGVRNEFQNDAWQPLGLSDDYVTYCPSNGALAMTWNRELAKKAGTVLGEEARGRGKDVILAPGINLKRTPLCGRNFEYFSEDPFLTGEMASSVVRGIQEWDAAACVKHFACNNQETDRLQVDVGVEEEALREIYLPAFYACVKKGNALTVMGAYNRLYGEHCCHSGFLLEGILRQEWGYDGVVISDWGGVHDTCLAGNSALDIEMSVTGDFDKYYMAAPLKEAVEKGLVEERRIDEKVCHILMLMMRLHMLDGKRKTGKYNTPGHREKALDIARESIVLLKNEENLLPLSQERIKKLLVIGDNAERLHANGGGSAEIKALYEISPLMGIKILLGGNVQVDFIRGYDVQETEADGEYDREREAEEECSREREAEVECGRKAQADGEWNWQSAASQYDAVIFIGGLNHEQDKEGGDRRDMKLPYGQDRLLQKLLEIRPDTVVVLIGGSPVEMGRWIHRAKAVLWSYYGGMETGSALAETLFGRVNPSGRLPETFYKTHTDCPAHCVGEFAQGKKVFYKEGVFVGYRFNETFGVKPEFPFGFGLSYTSFAYADGRIEKQNGRWKAQCRIANTGERQGAEVVQLYRIRPDRDSEPAQKKKPAKELIGFEKVFLQPGESRMVSIEGEGSLEGYQVGIGASVEDIRILL